MCTCCNKSRLYEISDFTMRYELLLCGNNKQRVNNIRSIKVEEIEYLGRLYILDLGVILLLLSS